MSRRIDAEMWFGKIRYRQVGKFPNHSERAEPLRSLRLGAVNGIQKGAIMLGKIAGALIGEHFAGKDKSAKGAILGIMAETVIKKVVPTIATIAILGYAYKKAKDFLEEEFGDNEPDYPSEATPSSPAA